MHNLMHGDQNSISIMMSALAIMISQVPVTVWPPIGK